VRGEGGAAGGVRRQGKVSREGGKVGTGEGRWEGIGGEVGRGKGGGRGGESKGRGGTVARSGGGGRWGGA